jgi:hypothetical protein
MLVAGRDVCFTMSVTDEPELVADRVMRLRRCYPACRVVLFPEREGEWQLDAGVSVEPVEHLYDVTRGGTVVRRHLEAFVATGCNWWFKVDPDTVAWRALRSLPADVCFFGTIQGGGPGPSLQGGCIGGTREAATTLLVSGSLEADLLSRPAASWAKGNPNLLRRAFAGLVSFDFVHAWACREAGIAVVAHAEIRSEWREPPPAPWRWAFTHPHKTLDLAAESRRALERQALARRLVALIDRELPSTASVAVVSKGDESLINSLSRRARHFPGDADGGWAGYHPADSAEALAMLERDRLLGVDHFALPQTGDWWLDHYEGLARYLATRCQLVAQAPGAGRIWALAATRK